MSEPHALSHHLTDLLTHLIRSALLADEQAVAARRDALHAHEALRDDLAGADLSAVKLDGLWSLAKGRAESPEFDHHPLQASRQLTTACPVSLADLTGPSLPVSDLEERVRGAGSLG